MRDFSSKYKIMNNSSVNFSFKLYLTHNLLSYFYDAKSYEHVPESIVQSIVHQKVTQNLGLTHITSYKTNTSGSATLFTQH